jgi:hypothetical protein
MFGVFADMRAAKFVHLIDVLEGVMMLHLVFLYDIFNASVHGGAFVLQEFDIEIVSVELIKYDAKAALMIVGDVLCALDYDTVFGAVVSSDGCDILQIVFDRVKLAFEDSFNLGSQYFPIDIVCE